MKTETNQNPGASIENQVQSQDSDSKLEELKKKAEAGDADAQYELAFELQYDNNEDEAIEWYKKASDNGVWRATKELIDLIPDDKTKYLHKMVEQRDEGYYGIQAFDNPTEAWKVMQDNWGEAGCDDTQYLYVLDDDGFKHALLYRAVDCFCQKHFGLITKEECEKKLGISLCEESNYLLDFNYIHYSKQSNRYYTSRMEMKDNYNNIWSSRQWEIYDELRNIHNFYRIYIDAYNIFQSVLESIEEYGVEKYHQVINCYFGIHYTWRFE